MRKNGVLLYRCKDLTDTYAQKEFGACGTTEGEFTAADIPFCKPLYSIEGIL